MKVGEVYALLGMDFAQFNKDERTAKRRTETLGSSLSGVLKNAFSFTLGMGFFQAVQAGFRSTVGTMIGFNSQMEMAQIGFTTMLGSAQRAKRFLDDVANFAAKTPFEFPDLLDASKRMLAYGFAAEDVLPTMQAVGNATAAVGLGSQGIDRIILALGQMRAKGKVSGEEMRQLTETGIPAWEILAEAMGKSTAEVMDLSQRGLIPADQAVKMFTEGMNKRFPDMMSKMENTWEGVTSTIKDVWQMTIGEVTKGLFQGAVSWLQKVRDTATGFYDAFRAGGLQYAIEQTFGAGVAASVSTLTSALKGLWGIVSGVGRAIVRNWALIRNLTLGVVWAFSAFKIAVFAVGSVTKATSLLALVTGILRGEAIKTSLTTGFLARVIQTYNLQLHLASMAGVAHVGVLQVLKTAIYSVTAALGTLLWPLLIIGAVLGIGVSLWSKYNQAVQKAAMQAQMDKLASQQKSYQDAVNEAAQGTDNQSDALKNLGKAASKNLQSFDEIHSLSEDMADATGLGDMFGDTPGAPAIPEIPEFDISAFSFDMDAAIAEAKAEMGGFWGWFKESALDAWDSVKQWGANLWEGVKGGWDGFKGYAGGLWENLKTGAARSWEKIKSDASIMWDGVKTVWGTFKDWAGDHWEGMKTKASETWQNIKTGAATGWANIKTAVQTKWGEMKTGASNTWTNIKTSASTAWQNIGANALTAWSSIKTTISTKWNDLKTEAPHTWEAINTAIKSKWESLKASAPQTWEDIKTAIATRFESAKTTVLNAAQELYDKVPKSWDEMRAAIDALKDKVISAITGPFEAAKKTVLGIIDSAKSWGKNLISNIVDGIKAKVASVKSAVQNVASTIKGWLGFGSPTEEGPGRYADRWAPNLMRMYTKGILDNISMVQSAAGQVARSLMPMATMPAPAFAGMDGVTRGGGLADELAAALRAVGGIGGNRPIEVTINIDGRHMARALIPALQSEQDRVETNTIIRTK